MSIETVLPKNIKKYRKKLGWSQQDLAIKSGLPLSIITKIEQGITTQPTIQTVTKIAKSLSVSIEMLIS